MCFYNYSLSIESIELLIIHYHLNYFEFFICLFRYPLSNREKITEVFHNPNHNFSFYINFAFNLNFFFFKFIEKFLNGIF